ncbi:hypothetical protein [Micromonospora sp. NPDC005710]|uniref:hypothetical protein n=1 Tax=Micromonospora sp. NPDC005710 TaxID=3157051 RepID=UPI0033F0AF86
MSAPPLPSAGAGVPLVVAVDRFLDRFRNDQGTRTTYAVTLTRLRDLAGDLLPVGHLTAEVYETVMGRWDDKAANTFNKHLSALNSFAAYCRRQEWLTTDPGRRLERRKVTRARDKPYPGPASNGCSPTTATSYANGCCGGCSTKPAPAPTKSSASTSPTLTWSSAAP